MYKSIRLPCLKKIITITVILVALANTARSQIIYNTSPDYYSVPMKRLLALYVGNFINQVTQGQLDLDSSTLVACQIYHINRLLPYNAGFDGNETTPGMLLINSGQISKARNQLPLLKGDEKIKRIFELGTYYLFKPQNGKSDLDSAKHYYDLADALVTTLSTTKWNKVRDDLYGKYYSRAGDLQKGQVYFDKLVNLAITEKDEPALTSALFTQADFLPFTSPIKLKILQRSLLLSQKLKLNILQLQAANEIFTVHFMMGNPVIDAEIAQILKFEKAIGFRHLQYGYSVYAYIAETQANNLGALRYAQESYKSALATGDNALVSIYDLRMGDVLMKFDDVSQAIIWYQKALSGPKTSQNQVFWYMDFLDEIQALISGKRVKEALELIKSIDERFSPKNGFEQMQLDFYTARCYDKLGNYSKAEALYQSSYRLIAVYPPEFIHMTLSDAYSYIADFYFKERKFQLCRLMVQKLISLNSASSTIVNKIDTYQLAAKLDSIDHNYRAAYQDYKTFNQLSDIQHNTQVRQEYNQLNVQFETVNKDRDIKLLKQANELQNTRLKQDNYYRKMTVGAIALISIIAALLYYLYRSKQHSNIKLQGQQKVLENLITEKEWLVKEIHHRVKNNLHTIVSLLESQSAYLHNDDALAAVRDSQHRVHAMSLIHQKLYMGDNMTSIKSADYIKELVNYLKESFNLGNTVFFQIDVEQIDLDVSQAIPLGLIINEAITNSIKYAFNKPGGKIIIKLIEISGSYLLKIEDNGVGLPKNFNVNDRTKSLGMSLISGLTKEIGGQFNIVGDNGTCVSILFPPYEIFI